MDFNLAFENLHRASNIEIFLQNSAVLAYDGRTLIFRSTYWITETFKFLNLQFHPSLTSSSQLNFNLFIRVIT